MKTVQGEVQNVDKNVGNLRTETEKKFTDLNSNLDNKFDAVHKAITDGFEKADKKYANRWVEDATIWAVRIVIGAVILALLGLVIVKTGVTGV